MSNQEIKPFDELNDYELEVLGMFRSMKIEVDIAKLQLFIVKMDFLLDKYVQLQGLRDDIRINFMDISTEIGESDFVDVDYINYASWGNLFDEEKDQWKKESDLIFGIKNYFEQLLKQLQNGEIEQEIIKAERNVDVDY